MCEGERHCNSTRWRRDAPRLVSHPGGDADCSAIPIDFFEKNFQLIIIRRVKTGVQTGADLHEPDRGFFFSFRVATDPLVERPEATDPHVERTRARPRPRVRQAWGRAAVFTVHPACLRLVRLACLCSTPRGPPRTLRPAGIRHNFPLPPPPCLAQAHARAHG